MWAPLTKMSYAGTAYRTLPEHLSSPLVFSVVRVIRYLVLYVCFVDRCLSFCTFSFGHCVVCSSSIYGFRLPLWYLQTLLWLSIVSNSLALHTWILSSETKIVCGCTKIHKSVNIYATELLIVTIQMYFGLIVASNKSALVH